MNRFAAIIVAFVVSFVASQSFAAVILTAPTLHAKTGDLVEVPITVAGAKGMSGLQMRLTYDPAVLAVVTSDTDPDAGFVKGPILPQNAIVKVFTDTPGRLPIVFLGGADPTAKTVHAVEEDGTLVTIRFRVIGAGGAKTALTLEKVEAFEASDMDMAVRATAGELTVAFNVPWQWIAVAAAAVLLLIILRLALRKRPTS